MLGIIVTGHGEFATGMAKNVKMLSGSDLTAINFSDGITPEQLDEKLADAVNALDECLYILIFCDLPGGTPYNRSVMLTLNNPKVRVIAGTNVPMLLAATLKNIAGEDIENVDELIDNLFEEAKAGICKFVMPALNQSEELEEEDGI